MIHIKSYNLFENIRTSMSNWAQYVIDDAIELWKSELPTKSGTVGPLFYGTTSDFTGFDKDFERSEFVYDFDLPDGFVFLTDDPKEARMYPGFETTGKMVVPMYIKRNYGILTFKVNTNAPSRAFDDDYAGYGGLGMWDKFVNGDHDKWVLEIKGTNKSTFVTYPDIPTYDINMAMDWSVLPNKKSIFEHAEKNEYIKRILEKNNISK
jgi:hypothetical protein